MKAFLNLHTPEPLLPLLLPLQRTFIKSLISVKQSASHGPQHCLDPILKAPSSYPIPILPLPHTLVWPCLLYLPPLILCALLDILSFLPDISSKVSHVSYKYKEHNSLTILILMFYSTCQLSVLNFQSFFLTLVNMFPRLWKEIINLIGIF